MGPCRIRLNGRVIYHDIVFLDEEMPAQNGSVTLAAYGLQLDPGGKPVLVALERRMPSR